MSRLVADTSALVSLGVAARRLLDDIGAARSWEGNSYVRRVRSLLDDSGGSAPDG